MAEEEKKEESKQEEKKSSSLVLIIVAVLIVLLLAVAGVVVYLLLSQDEQAIAQNNQNGAEVTQVQRKSAMDLTVGPMYPLDQFIVNLLSEGGRRYLKTTIDFELSDDSLIEELDTKIPRVRDIIIRVLSSKTVEEISTPKGKEKLKQELTNQLNAVLVDGQIVRLYFTDFVIQ